MLGYLAHDQWWPAGHGFLVVTSDPPGAQIWLDLKPTNFKTNGRLGLVATGKHSVMVKLDTLECDPVAQVVEVRQGRADTVRFRFKPPEAVQPDLAAGSPSDRFPDLPPIENPLGTKPVSPAERPRSSQQADTARHVKEPPHPNPTHAEPSEVMEPPAATGVLQIAASVPGAKIFINDKEQAQTAPTSVKLSAGTYIVRVELKGYSSDPPDQTLSILRGSPLQSVFFSLTAQIAERQISAETAPFAGKILINGAPVGLGKITLPSEFGSYTVSFGDSQGWQTPSPIQVSITPTQPQPSVKGVYTRIFRASAQVDGGKPTSPSGIRWQTGAYFEDEGAVSSASLGPRIRPIPGSSKSGWELAEGDPNRNPVGGDYVEFVFTLPPDANPKAPLNLRLYLYRSSKRYAFSLAGRSEVVVTVNGHRFLDGYRPQYGTADADEGRFEEWSLVGVLVRGENRIMVRSGDQNSLFNYLWKIEIL